MKKVRFSRYYLLLCVPVLLALVGLIWGRPAGGGKPKFDLDDLNGRYVSAETGYDVSTAHAEGDTVGPPIFYSDTGVMQADGKGNVCGASDGFYGGFPVPGVNFGESYFHGTYTVGATDGRVVFSLCSDTGFCATSGACSTVTSEWVGYLQSCNGNQVTAASQGIGTSGSNGTWFNVRSMVWTKDASSESHF